MLGSTKQEWHFILETTKWKSDVDKWTWRLKSSFNHRPNHGVPGEIPDVDLADVGGQNVGGLNPDDVLILGKS